MEQKTKISKKNAEKLERAYMDLYKSLVHVYQKQNNTNGQSWYNAIDIMDKIMMFHKAEQETNPVISFLFDLYYTHRPTIVKKCMESPNKDKFAKTTKDCAHDLQSAIDNFEQTIAMATNGINGQNSKAGTLVLLPRRQNTVSAQPFFDWVQNTVDPATVEKLENDPRQFEILYNKYIKRQKYR